LGKVGAGKVETRPGLFTNLLAQTLSRFLGFYGFSAEQNGFYIIPNPNHIPNHKPEKLSHIRNPN